MTYSKSSRVPAAGRLISRHCRKNEHTELRLFFGIEGILLI